MAIKTTEHWRDRDLLSRRFVPAGQGRVAYVKYSVDRLINEKRARRILEQELHFIYNPLFDWPNAEEVILGTMPEAGHTNGKLLKAPKGLPPYLANLYEIPC